MNIISSHANIITLHSGCHLAFSFVQNSVLRRYLPLCYSTFAILYIFLILIIKKKTPIFFIFFLFFFNKSAQRCSVKQMQPSNLKPPRLHSLKIVNIFLKWQWIMDILNSEMNVESTRNKSQTGRQKNGEMLLGH